MSFNSHKSCLTDHQKKMQDEIIRIPTISASQEITAEDVLDSRKMVRLLTDPIRDKMDIHMIDIIGNYEYGDSGDCQAKHDTDSRFLGDVYQTKGRPYLIDTIGHRGDGYAEADSYGDGDVNCYFSFQCSHDPGDYPVYIDNRLSSDIKGYLKWLDITANWKDKTHDRYQNLMALKNNYRRGAEFIKFVEKYQQVAVHGNIESESTTVDDSVRKGRDITLAPLIEAKLFQLRCGDKLKQMFGQMSGMYNVTIVPYKINCYEEGDHFVWHRDSPSQGMVGTIVINLAAGTGTGTGTGTGCDTLTGCFQLKPSDDSDDIVTWTATNNDDRITDNVCIFYPEVEHRVLPVRGWRYTLTLKVYHTVRSELKINVKLNSNLMNRVPVGQHFGILLQHGYHYTQGRNPQHVIQQLKGRDRQIYQDLTALTSSGSYQLAVVPVMVDNCKEMDPYSSGNGYGYGYGDGGDGGGGYGSDDDYGYGYGGKGDGTNVKYSDSTQYKYDYTGTKADMKTYFEISDVPEDFLSLINKGNPVDNKFDRSISNERNTSLRCYGRHKVKVFYLGSGYRFFRIDSKNVYIGNEYAGQKIEQIYFNFMLEYRYQEV